MRPRRSQRRVLDAIPFVAVIVGAVLSATVNMYLGISLVVVGVAMVGLQYLKAK